MLNNSTTGLEIDTHLEQHNSDKRKNPLNFPPVL